MRLLFLGDIVGEPGRKAVISRLPSLKAERQIDFVVANGENVAGGRGITARLAIELLRAGVAVITTGDHVWDQKEVVEYFPTEPRLLRPANYPAGTAGQGSIVLETSKGKVGVLNLQGRTFMLPPLENPFLRADEELAELHKETRVIFVDMHSETTSEKIAMGRYLDGRISGLCGTHTHVQTADEQILPNGTAFLCDAGMCGPVDSILGRAPDAIIKRFLTSMPNPFPIAKGDVRLCGAVIDIDEETGHALKIERINELVKQSPEASAA